VVTAAGDVCEWCGEVDCGCPPGFKPVDECPPMCDCGACDGPRPEVTVVFEPVEVDA
jgi:hypothetical protein